MTPSSPEARALAQQFHEAYERLAPQFGYETRRASAVQWADVPPANRDLMIAVCAEVLARGASLSSPAAPREPSPPRDRAEEYLRTLGWPDDEISQGVRQNVETHVRYFARWLDFGDHPESAPSPTAPLAALELYGEHLPDCAWRIATVGASHPCSCGFDATLERARATAERGTP